MARAPRLVAAAMVAVALCAQQLVAASTAGADPVTVTVTDWPSLQAAFLAGGTVVLGADIDSGNQQDQHLVVGDGQAVSLDLNDHNLTVYGYANGNYDVAGITVAATAGTSLTIGDSSPDGQGTLNASAGDYGAGIGGDENQSGGNVTVTGGVISVVAGGYGSGAGIGSGGADNGATDINGGSLTVSGGYVQAQAGGFGSAGIGGGYCASGGSLTVTGDGGVGADGSYYSAGIGSGGGFCGFATSGGTVDVSGGSVDAETGYSSGPAIGGSYNGSAADVEVSGGSLSVGMRSGDPVVGIGNGPGYDGPVAGSLDVMGGYVRLDDYGYTDVGIGGANGAPGIPVHIGAAGTMFVDAPDSFDGGSTAQDGSAQDWGSLTNDGDLTVYGGALTVPAGVTVHNSGRFTVFDAALSGAGTFDNSGVITVQDPGPSYGGRVVNDGQGAPGITVTHHNYRLHYDTNGGPDSSPGQSVVFADTFADAGQGQPTVSAPSGKTFRGWFTAATGGTEVTSTTDLATVFGAGPVDTTLYAHYRGPQTISFTSTAPDTARVGTSYTVAATASSGNPVTFAVGSDTSNNACTVSGSTVTFVHPGFCEIAADQAGDTDTVQPATEVTQGFGVARGTQNISFDSTAPSAARVGDGTYTVAATGGASGNPVTFSVDPSTTYGACTVSGSTVTIQHAGVCAVAADQAGTADWFAGHAVQTFAVGTAGQTITWDSTSPAAVVDGPAYTPVATGGASGKPVTFSVDPSTTNHACAIEQGNVAFHHAGTCVLAADQAGTADYDAAPTQLKSFTVGRGDQLVDVASPQPTGSVVGGTYVPVAFAPGGSVTYSTSGTACSLDQGTVHFTHAGTCTVNFDQVGDDDYTAAQQVQQVFTVGKGTQSILVTSVPPNGVVGGTYTPTATAPGGPVTYSTSGTACSLNAGVVHLDHPGTCTVNFDQTGDDDYTAAPQVQHVFAVAAIGASVALSTTPTSAVYGQSAHATASVTVGHGTVSGTVQFSVDGTSLGSAVPVVDGSATSPALVDANGDALDVATHTIGADFVPTSNDYASAGNTASLVVARASTTSGIAIVAGHLTATVTAVAPGAGTPTGTVQFTVAGRPFGSATLDDGTATLDQALPAGSSHRLAAVYAGDAAFTGSSASTGQSHPTISATVTGSPAKTRSGWYRGSVTVRFHCTTDGAALASACPAPVVLRHEGAAQSVSRTVVAIDGGAKTVVVRGIDIDHTSPTVAIAGVRNGGVYRGTAPRVRCAGHDRLSGVASCRLTQRSTSIAAGRVVHYSVTATDRVGNRRTAHGSYTVLTRYVDGAAFRDGAFEIKAGRAYTIVVIGGASRPVYYNAEVAPRRPAQRGSTFHAAGHGHWTLGISMDGRMRSHRYWNVGVRTGRTMHVLRLRVTNAH